jgi:tetratricopeptide (TPR) repeat protein
MPLLSFIRERADKDIIHYSFLCWIPFCVVKKKKKKKKKKSPIIFVVKSENTRIEMGQQSSSMMHFVAESTSDKCHKCHEPFTFNFSKLHCGECGDIFCYNCSSLHSIPSRGYTPQRVCEDCFACLSSPRVDFSQGGVSLKALLQFVDKYRAGLSGMTTADVTYKIIKPLTLGMECSFAEYLARRRRGVEDKLVSVRGNLFVSHAWNYPFLQVVEVLTTYTRQTSASDDTIFFWFDCLVVNQHIHHVVSFEDLRGLFGENLKAIGTALIVIIPWRNPIYIDRCWCIFELYTILHHKIDHHIMMPESEEKDFISELIKGFHPEEGGLFAHLKINSQAAHAREPVDEENIKKAIAASVGFALLDSTIYKALFQWFLLKGKEHMSRMDENSDDYWYLVLHLSMLMTDEGDINGAERLERLCLKGFERKYGPNHQATLTACHNLAVNLSNQKMFSESEMLHRDCLEKRQRLYGRDDAQTLFSLNSLAMCLKSQGRLADAMELFDECLQRRTNLYGPAHPLTIVSLGNYAICLDAQGRFSEAESAMRDCLNRNLSLPSGKSHPHVITTLNCLASCLIHQGKMDEARPFIRESIQLSSVIHGKETLHALTNLCNMAVGLNKVRAFDQAEALYHDCLRGFTNSVGPDHHLTINCVNNLAVCLRDQGRLADAETMLRGCVEKSAMVLGKNNSYTLRYEYNLAKCLFLRDKRSKEAREICEGVLLRMSAVLDKSHSYIVDAKQLMDEIAEEGDM